MKKWAVLISAVGLAFSVSGCSSDYVMATKDGRMILTTVNLPWMTIPV